MNIMKTNLLGAVSMKTIMCFGDSNTWGFNPENGRRYRYEERWTSVLQKSLGDDYLVIPEGFNGRTTVFTDPFIKCRNGLKVLPSIIGSHYPIDLLVIMLGTNDTKTFFNQPVDAIGRGIEALVKAVRGKSYGGENADPEIMIVAPAPVTGGDAEKAAFDIRQFWGDAAAKSRELAREYAERAKTLQCAFFDAAKVATVSPIDGVHLTRESHKALGVALAKAIADNFSA
jgi:lysophospholipase L1-like esterase